MITFQKKRTNPGTGITFRNVSLPWIPVLAILGKSQVKGRVEGRPWPPHPRPWTLSRANHPGPGRWRGTYRIKIGEEVDCGRRVERKWEKRLNVQRRLQRRGWRPDQGWESGALACATCTKEKKGHSQGPGAWEHTALSGPGLF